jgi:hypothetical protein
LEKATKRAATKRHEKAQKKGKRALTSFSEGVV